MQEDIANEFRKIWRALRCKASCGSVGGGGWSLTGNAGTDQLTNFIGTTDAQSLVFKTNGETSGFIGESDDVIDNVSFGYKALNNSYSGASNTAIGNQALQNNTDGDSNTGIGNTSLFLNTIGVENTAIGNRSLYQNTTGNGNTGIGTEALFSNMTGNYNTAIGHETDIATDSTSNAIALGYGAVASTNQFAIPSTITNVKFGSLPEFSDNAAATGGGLAVGSLYMTTTGGSSFVKIVV